MYILYCSKSYIESSKIAQETTLLLAQDFFKPIELPPRIPGNATLPEEMSQPEVACVGQSGAKEDHPWRAPGTAPVFGPCGSMGGMPLGCDNDGEGSFGDCCSGNCDSFALGGNAEAYQWPNMPTTEWTAGSFQEVAWHLGANHAGGYSYRICKMPGTEKEYLEL